MASGLVVQPLNRFPHESAKFFVPCYIRKHEGGGPFFGLDAGERGRPRIQAVMLRDHITSGTTDLPDQALLIRCPRRRGGHAAQGSPKPARDLLLEVANGHRRRRC
jgi:hypothetical protein